MLQVSGLSSGNESRSFSQSTIPKVGKASFLEGNLFVLFWCRFFLQVICLKFHPLRKNKSQPGETWFVLQGSLNYKGFCFFAGLGDALNRYDIWFTTLPLKNKEKWRIWICLFKSVATTKTHHFGTFGWFSFEDFSYTFTLCWTALSHEQMSNKARVEHQPVCAGLLFPWLAN